MPRQTLLCEVSFSDAAFALFIENNFFTLRVYLLLNFNGILHVPKFQLVVNLFIYSFKSQYYCLLLYQSIKVC